MLSISRKFPVILAALAAGGAAHAYEIGSGNMLKPAFDVHETMTTLAQECLASQTQVPFDCRAKYAELTRRVQQADPRPSPTDLRYATRWPDDPTRKLASTGGKVTFGATLLRECGPWTGGAARMDNAGLLCSSHYGRLSFMHAMQVPQAVRSASDMRLLVREWATFAFDAATNQAFRDENFCAATERLGAGSPLRAELTMADGKFCDPARKKHWRVRTFFALTCGKITGSKSCSEAVGPAGDARAVAAAKGALLHLIQDSFSQAHVYRPTAEKWPEGEAGGFVSMIACTPPQAWYDYRGQRAEIHNLADKPPQLDLSCRDDRRAVDDPVTAGATILYLIDKGDRDGFVRYLDTRVFPAA